MHDGKYPSEAVDVPHIVVRKSGAKHIFVYILAHLVLASAFYLHVLKEKSINFVYYSLLFDIFLVKLFLRKPVERVSVVIMPAFGVQLETLYMSGKVNRCFVPIDKILKPVLLMRDSSDLLLDPILDYSWGTELQLVFKNLRPPVKMLVQVWKALRAATGSKEGLDTCAADN